MDIRKNGLQKSLEQIGLATLRYLPRGMKLCYCDLHGTYLAHYKTENATCPLCPVQDTSANGTSASQIEHYIDLKNTIDPPVIGNNTSGSGVHC